MGNTTIVLFILAILDFVIGPWQGRPTHCSCRRPGLRVTGLGVAVAGASERDIGIAGGMNNAEAATLLKHHLARYRRRPYR
jgi:hypothetical protein